MFFTFFTSIFFGSFERVAKPSEAQTAFDPPPGLVWINEEHLCAAVSADGKQLLTSHTDGLVRLWNLDAGKQIWQMPVDLDVRGLSFSRDGRFAVAGTARGMVYVWRLPTGPPYPAAPTADRTLPDGTHEHVWNTLVFHTAYAPDGKHYLAVGDWSNQVRVWDDESGKMVRVLPGLQWAEFQPNSKHVLAFQRDGSIAVMELATGRSIRRFGGHANAPAAFDFIAKAVPRRGLPSVSAASPR